MVSIEDFGRLIHPGGLLVQELENKLNVGPTRFTYKKKDGEVRHAYGVKNHIYISENFGDDKLPSGTGKHKDGVLAYYDIDKEAWRSCKYELVVSIDE